MSVGMLCPQCGMRQLPGEKCVLCGTSLTSSPLSFTSPEAEATVTQAPPPQLRQSPRAEELPPERLSWMAITSLACGITFWPALVALSDAVRCERIVSGRLAGFFFIVVIVLLALSVMLGGFAAIRIRRSRGRLKGLRLAQLAVTLGMMNALWSISTLPELVGIEQRSKYDEAMSESRMAVSQAIRYANTRGAYPTSLRVLRESGYSKVRNQDPWGNDWILSPLLTAGGAPKQNDDVYIYSKGPRGTGTYRPGYRPQGKTAPLDSRPATAP